VTGGPRHLAGRVVFGGLAAALTTAATAAAVAASGYAKLQPVPASGVGSYRTVSLGPSWLIASCLATAPDGSVWVLGNGNGHPWRLIHVTTEGPVQTIALAATVQVQDSSDQCLTVAPDGHLWFSLSDGGIAEYDPGAGRLTTFSPPRSTGGAMALAASPDGSVWFTVNGQALVGRISPEGAISEFPLPSLFHDGPTVLLALPDGDLWANPCSCVSNSGAWTTLAELSPGGSVLRTYTTPQGAAGALALGPGGGLWYAYGQVPWGIGTVTSAGARPLPWNLFSEPTDMLLGPDGRIWFVTSNFADWYGDYDPSSRTLVAHQAPGPPSSVWGLIFAIALGPGPSVAMTAHDNHLYEIDTGVAAASSSESTISSSLPTPVQAFSSGAAVVAGVAASAGALLFVTFPSNLFNLTFRENYSEIREWLLRLVMPVTRWRRRAVRSAGDAAARPGERAGAEEDGRVAVGEAAAGPSRGREPERAQSRRRELAVFAAVVLVGAALGSLLDPRFGSGIGSLYTYIAVALAIFAGAAIPAWVTWAYHRGRRAETGWHLQALPAGLAVAAVCVLISRLTSFQPGYLYGIICGVAFSARTTTAQKGHLVALSSLSTVVVSVLAWLAWVPAHSAASGAGAAFAPVILADFLASVFVSGLVGTVISLLPLRFLPGWDLHRWHLGAWLGCFGLATFGVIEVLLIPHTAGRSHAPLVTSLVLLVLFGGVSIGLREWFAARRRHAEGRDGMLSFRQRVRELLTPVEADQPESQTETNAGQPETGRPGGPGPAGAPA
jgi:virginiamycin B lyase